MKLNLTFLRQFFLRPIITGAIAPSSQSLAVEMMAWLDLENACSVVEYGPGTGVFTDAVVARLSESCKFLMIEVNPFFVELLRKRHPKKIVYEDSVKNVRRLCEREGIAEVDCIISGLPWAWFPDAMQTEYLDALMSVLKPGGQFVTFAYLHGLLMPAGQQFRRRLQRYFSQVTRSQTVWMNLPPAFVYRCRR
jgi:phosphatidylethanolamine/phosphatidyl-N-methylethanolamine N-methyltransferase